MQHRDGVLLDYFMVQVNAHWEVYWELINLLFPAAFWIQVGYFLTYFSPCLLCFWKIDHSFYLAEYLSVWRRDFMPVVKSAKNFYSKTDIQGCV